MLHALKDPSEAYERICSMLQIMTSKSPVTELETTPVSADVERPDLHIVSPSNTSSTRSSPLIPSLSPHSPTPTIRKRHSRSSLQFPVSDMPYGNEVHRRRHSGRSPYAANRLSAPALGSMYQTYFYQQQQQQQLQQLQQLQSYSQPSSPIISQFGTNDYTTFPTTPHRTASLSRKTGLRRSASSTGDFMIPPQRPRAPSRPYMNPRRHTLTNATPPDLSNEIASSPSVDTTRNLYAMAVRNNQFNTQPYMIPITSHHQHQQMQQQQQQHQQLLQQQQLQQTLMLDPASFPMDPVIPDSPNDSMMNLLLNPWDFSSQ
ncbi:hypothetical protein CU098_011111 [Rhizopus stolonifer]|uniref:Uncharacterized protein n=2 Tax=Mucorineae TaxID=1344963 RepID=A0A367K8P3_RHIST|nr:hypothetical protein CU098_011111 [Rhizopus stolonifer]